MKTVRRGYALATILILLGVSMFGAAALVTISILESKLSRSQVEGTVAYYAAEAGLRDAVWRLNNTPAYKAALAAGNLNVSYSVSNQPANGQGFSVIMLTSAQGAGYAEIDVTSTADNGTFVAQRRVEATVFQGAGNAVADIGNNAMFGGGNLSITNGSGTITVTGGDLYSRGNTSVNQATITMPGQFMKAVGNYTQTNSTVTSAGTNSTNFPAAPANITPPGYNFSQYSSLPTNRCTSGQYASQTQLRCTPAQFQSLIGGSTNFTFPNAVVYISGNLTLNSWVQNKTININGLFVVNGNFSTTTSANNFRFNVNDPGTGNSGIVVSGNYANNDGTWDIEGIMYTAGNLAFTGSQSVTVNGAVVTGGNLEINAGLNLNLTYNGARAATVLGGTVTPSAVQVQHWEEEY